MSLTFVRGDCAAAIMSLKLERIPLEMLVLLVEHRGEIVTRDEIVSQGLGQRCFPRYRQQHQGCDPQASSGAEG